MAKNGKPVQEEDGLPGNWEVIDTEPIIPGVSNSLKPVVPAPSPVQMKSPELGNYFSGSMPPDIQHDGQFIKTGYQTGSVVRTPLMPTPLVANPQNTAGIQSVIREFVTVAATPTTGVSSVDALIYRGAWNAFTAYQVADVVLYSGFLYVAITGSTNVTPAGNPAYWTELAGAGSVTSVAMTVPSILSVAGSPIVTTGTFAITLVNQNANKIFAGPTSGGSASPTFRSLVLADLPSLSAADLTNGTTGSGAVMLAISPTTTGTLGADNAALTAKVTKYNNISTVDNGVPSELAHANLTAQTAAIVATTLYTPTATGRFRVSVYLKVTTVASVSSALGGVTITFTDGTDSVAQSCVMALADQTGAMVTSNTGNTTTSVLHGSMFIYAKTGIDIKYAIAYTSVNAAEMVYAARITCEAL